MQLVPVTLCEVSTLPPTTAAVAEGCNKDCFGRDIVIGARHPWLRGMSIMSGRRQRRQYMTAEVVTAGGALRLPNIS